MKQLPILVLKGCACVGASLYSLCVLSGFDGRAGSEVNTSHILPQSVLEAITLVEGGAGHGGAGARGRCKLGLLHSSVANTALSGMVSGPKLLEQKP